MAKNLLDYDGLGYFLSKLKAWVEAKGYTTNTGTITSVKTTAGAHTTINATSGSASFNVPTKTSHLTNDSNFAVDSAYVHTDNNFTTALKNKLNGIAAGAEVNVVKSVDTTATNGVNLSLDNDGKLDVTVTPGSITSGNTGVVTGGTVYSTTSTLAPKASPEFTGTPKAPTAAAGTNSTQIATTAFVTGAITTLSGTIPTSTSDLTNDSNFPSDANYVHTDNNYTTTEKNKLAGIASGAEVNQNAFSNVKVGTTTVAADAKTDTLTLEAGDNITITPDATNDKITITATDTTYSNATTSVAGLMSADDKTKLNGIAAGAEVNVVKSVDTTAGTSGINLSLTSGKLDVTISSGSIASGNSNFVTGGTVYSTTSLLAPKASPALTGTPTAPTATVGTNSTQIATTEFVNNSIASAQTGRAAFQGAVDANTTIQNANYAKGYHWIVQTAGTYVGQVCEVGDMIYCIADKGASYSAADFTVIQNNLDIEIITDAQIDLLFAS